MWVAMLIKAQQKHSHKEHRQICTLTERVCTIYTVCATSAKENRLLTDAEAQNEDYERDYKGYNLPLCCNNNVVGALSS